SVADAAALLTALAGVDASDPATAAAEGHIAADYTRFLDTQALRGARIGVARKLFGFNERVDKLMAAALDVLKDCGAELVDPVNLDKMPELDEHELEVLLYEFKADLNAYLGRLEPRVAVHSLRDVIEFNTRHAHRTMPYFGQEHMLAAQEKGPLT